MNAMSSPLTSLNGDRSQPEFVPQWAKTVVWYQIFPERFRNGDPGNDPKVTDIAGADPAEAPRVWHIHPWARDWYERQPYENQNGEPELWIHLARRRYGGDLQGILDKLDYLKNLGVGAIYLNPVFDAPSHHKYDGASYHHIDPTFGPDPSGDRLLITQEDTLDPSTWTWTSADELALTLIERVHELDMRIIFDGVFNHMGINSFAFRDLLELQQHSRYKDWFTVTSWRDSAQGTDFSYKGWYGVQSLPEFREDKDGLVSGPRDYIFAATKRWMNPKGRGSEYGIDGWRLDVAFCIAHPFWKAWRKHVKAINPDAYLTAELVDPPPKLKPYLQGDEFDGVMNYNFSYACDEFFFQPDIHRISVTTFDRLLRELREAFPDGVAQVSQNLFDSHDTDRLASHIVNRGIGRYRDWGVYHTLSKPLDNPEYCVRKPDAGDRHLQKLFVLFQMTYVGAPMIYYGDEVGMWGGNDPCCRKPMVWEDMDYTPERMGPDGSVHPPDTMEVDRNLLSFYRELIHIRNHHPALQTGTFHTLVMDDARGVYAFSRELPKEMAIIVINRTDHSRSVTLHPPRADIDWRDVLNKTDYFASESLHVSIAPLWGAILIADKQD
jgi:glycosidase